ncbi:MAG TPA: hypothetical protein VHK69_08470, partial [Chitinophagaceae bacterium]|nr:hypothetical protein [Chitinophagaceae bacterium]
MRPQFIMKAANVSLLTFLFLLSLGLFSCNKKDIFEPKPNPGTGGNPGGKPADSVYFNFAVDTSLVGAPYHSSSLTAEVSVANMAGDTVIREALLTLDLSGRVKTSYLRLPAGNYKITSFRMVHGGVYTRFATPRAGSVKAAGVDAPLAKPFTLEKGKLNEVPVEVLPVREGEKPALFGYHSGAFDLGQEDASPYFKIRMKAVLQVGEVLYDSIPATLRLTTWDARGEMTTAFVGLKAGANELTLPKATRK